MPYARGKIVSFGADAERTLLMRRTWLLLLVILCASSTPAQEPASSARATLTLEDAVNFAQENNRQLRNAKLTVAIDEEGVLEAKKYRLPSINLYALGSQLLTPVDFTFEQGVFGTYPGIGPVPTTETKIHTPLRPTFYGLAQISQ